MEFSNHNLRLQVQEEQKKFNLSGGGEVMKDGLDYRQLRGVAEAMSAYYNYTQVWMLLHPLDIWGQTSFRVGFDHFVNGEIKSAGPIIRIFHEVQIENEGRAEYSEMPLALGRNQQALVRDSVGSITP